MFQYSSEFITCTSALTSISYDSNLSGFKRSRQTEQSAQSLIAFAMARKMPLREMKKLFDINESVSILYITIIIYFMRIYKSITKDHGENERNCRKRNKAE